MLRKMEENDLIEELGLQEEMVYNATEFPIYMWTEIGADTGGFSFWYTGKH